MCLIEKIESINKLISKISKLMLGVSFKESDRVKLFALTSFSICKENFESIYLLMHNNLYYEVFMIFRHQIELMFRLYWIVKSTSNDEEINKVCKIEAESFRNFESEISSLTKITERIHFSDDFLEKLKTYLEEIKENYPHLVNDNKFLRCEKNDIMAGDLREKYYHQFKFLSILSHPNPISRKYFFPSESGEEFFKGPFFDSCDYAIDILKRNLDMIFNLIDNDLENIDCIKTELKDLYEI